MSLLSLNSKITSHLTYLNDFRPYSRPSIAPIKSPISVDSLILFFLIIIADNCPYNSSRYRAKCIKEIKPKKPYCNSSYDHKHSLLLHSIYPPNVWSEIRWNFSSIAHRNLIRIIAHTKLRKNRIMVWHPFWFIIQFKLLVESKNTNLIGVIFNRFRCDNNPDIRVGRDSHSCIKAVCNQPGVVACLSGVWRPSSGHLA
jgi:hypothetical protein